MNKYITEQVYVITYNPVNASYEKTGWFIANSIEESIALCKEINVDCRINDVRVAHRVIRKSTKTITVNV